METPKVPGEVGRQLAERRRALGLTRAQVARRARIAERTVRQLEEHQAEASPAVLWRLAAALETTPKRLFGAVSPAALTERRRTETEATVTTRKRHASTRRL
jgi:transcriptional regulator with XRE-family HTH domain